MRSSSEISRAETTRQHSFRHVLTAHERYNKSFRYLHNVCTRHTIVLGWHQLHSSLKRSLSKKLNTSSNVSFKNSSVRHFEKRNSSWSHRDYRVPGRNKTAAREKQKNKKKLFCRYLYFYLSIYNDTKASASLLQRAKISGPQRGELATFRVHISAGKEPKIEALLLEILPF
jgi:hypothetical protein